MPTMSKLCICGLNLASEGIEIAIFLYSCSYYSGPSLIQTSNIRLLRFIRSQSLHILFNTHAPHGAK